MKFDVDKLSKVSATVSIGTLDITEGVFNSDEMLVTALNLAGYLQQSLDEVFLNEGEDYLIVEDVLTEEPLLRLTLIDD